MKKQTVLFLFGILALSADLSAQFGFNAGYRWNDSDNWVEQSASGNQSLDLLPNGYSIGVDYWFRLKNARVEFLPELNYSSFAQTFADDREINARFLSFFFNTNFYLFDFMSDCDCPTFSKQDHTLQKGFFIQVSPGLSYLSNKGLSFNLELQAYTFSANSLAFSIGAAAGIDFGLSDLITLTPIAGLRFYPSAEWENLDEFTGDDPNRNIRDTATSILQYHAGIRLGLRFDH